MKSKQSKKIKASFKLKTIYNECSQNDLEAFDLMFEIYAKWVDRAVHKQISVKTTTSLSTEHSEHTALTSARNDRTVGVLNNCNSGGSTH
ncbi:hypothetical protein H8D57_03515 [bacterium]|nr:hypothetical protein [bacterium]